MTLAIAVVCAAGGVVLADSLTMAFGDNGKTVGLIEGGKVRHLAQAGLVYVHSGSVDLREGDPSDFEAVSFETAARDLFEIYARHHLKDSLGGLVDGEGRPLAGEELSRVQGAHELIAVNARLEEPRACLLTTHGEERWLGAEGGTLVAGAAATWWRATERPPPPSDLIGCQLVALQIAAAYHRSSYGDRTLAARKAEMAASGTALMPSTAPPWFGITVSALGIRRWAAQPSDTEDSLLLLARDVDWKDAAAGRPSPNRAERRRQERAQRKGAQ